jgi:hypothetical protein
MSNRATAAFISLSSARTTQGVLSPWSYCLAVGDIRRLPGEKIEIDSEVKGYDGHGEIILRRVSQLRGDAGRIPPATEGIRRGAAWERQGRQVQPSEDGKEPDPQEAVSASDLRRSQPGDIADGLASASRRRAGTLRLRGGQAARRSTVHRTLDQALAQLFQRILRSPPSYAVVSQRKEHRAQQGVLEE